MFRNILILVLSVAVLFGCSGTQNTTPKTTENTQSIPVLEKPVTHGKTNLPAKSDPKAQESLSSPLVNTVENNFKDEPTTDIDKEIEDAFSLLDEKITNNKVDKHIPSIHVKGAEKKEYKIKEGTNEKFISEVFGKENKIHHLSRSGFAQPVLHEYDEPYPVSKVSLMIQTSHNAFSEHVPITLSPEVLWYMIINEIAITVKANPSKYGHYFTDDLTKKKRIDIVDNSLIYGSEDNNWGRTIEMFREPLMKSITKKARNAFLPKFTTMTKEDETAILVTFMDVVSDFYEYHVWTKCGIPEVKLAGKPSDWNLLVEQTKLLKAMFDELNPYFNDLIPVLKEISDTANGEGIDQEFWCSIYKYKSMSGDELVSGWITSFNAYRAKEGGGYELKEFFDWKKQHKNWSGGENPAMFPSHVSSVPFLWHYLGTEIKMKFTAGIFGVEYEDNKLRPKLGFGIIEPKK